MTQVWPITVPISRLQCWIEVWHITRTLQVLLDTFLLQLEGEVVSMPELNTANPGAHGLRGPDVGSIFPGCTEWGCLLKRERGSWGQGQERESVREEKCDKEWNNEWNVMASYEPLGQLAHTFLSCKQTKIIFGFFTLALGVGSRGPWFTFESHCHHVQLV